LEKEQDNGIPADQQRPRNTSGTDSGPLHKDSADRTLELDEGLATPLAGSSCETKKPELQKANTASNAAPFHSTTTGSTAVWTPPSSPQRRKPRLLLVDDNKLNLHLLHTFVKQRQYGEDLCQLAEDGSQAVTAFDTFAPDIIFMDISMPVMEGIEATRCIRRIEAQRRDSDKTPVDESGPRTPKPALVVALTGNAKSSDQAEAMKSGVNVYMTKPCSFKRVGQLLDNWREEDEPSGS
jgi:CheY-like chemotaxis protein